MKHAAPRCKTSNPDVEAWFYSAMTQTEVYVSVKPGASFPRDAVKLIVPVIRVQRPRKSAKRRKQNATTT